MKQDPYLVNDLMKTLNEWALAAGTALRSRQTGFIHYFPGHHAEGVHHTIPLVENVLFILALFKSRTIEQIQEARQLLQCLLPFQQSDGNFPVYLHEYPQCNDRTLGLNLLPAFYWILAQFGHVIGKELREEFENACRKLVDYSLSIQTEKTLPYFLLVRMAAIRVAFGQFWQLNDYVEQGHLQLQELAKKQLEGWKSSQELSEILVSLQLVYPLFSESPWNALWDYLREMWVMQTANYQGPQVREWQWRKEPQPSLYDLYLGYFSKQFSKRIAETNCYHLKSVLIQPLKETFVSATLPYEYQGIFHQQKWETVIETKYAYTLLEKQLGHVNPSYEKMYTPFYLSWGNLQAMHSFVCQNGQYETVSFTRNTNQIFLDFELNADMTEERDKRREIEFFFDDSSDLRLTYEGSPTNIFVLDQEIILASEARKLSLVFHLLEGEGDFFGHLMRDNRPSQMANKNEHRFRSDDWTLFLRSIRRPGRCKVRVVITLLE